MKWAGIFVAGFIMLTCSGASSLSDFAIRSRIVQLESDRGFCIGEQVRGKTGKLYILTAAHCISLGGQITATTETGARQKIRLVYEAKTSDLALYTPVRGLLPFFIRQPRLHEAVRIFSHGLHHATYEAKGELLEGHIEDVALGEMPADGCKLPKYQLGLGFIGPPCILHTFQITTTAWAVPGSSGGPAVNSRGELIGVVSGGSDRFTTLVPSWVVYSLLKKF